MHTFVIGEHWLYGVILGMLIFEELSLMKMLLLCVIGWDDKGGQKKSNERETHTQFLLSITQFMI
jgi:hypothetical protein